MDILFNINELRELSQILSKKNPAYSFQINGTTSNKNNKSKILLIKIGGSKTLFQEYEEFLINNKPETINTPTLKSLYDLTKLIKTIINKYKLHITDIYISFAFPIKQISPEDNEVILLDGSKNHPLTDLVNTKKSLNKILSHQFGDRIKFEIINDIVELSLAGKYIQNISLILGTGINTSYMKDNQTIEVFEPGYYSNFPCLEDTNQILENNNQLNKLMNDSLFELETAGFGLYKIYNQINESRQDLNMRINSTKDLNKLAKEGDQLAQYIFQRSAQLVAAHISGLIKKYELNQKQVIINLNVSGSIIIEGYKYQENLIRTIKDIFRNDTIKINIQEFKGTDLSGLIKI